ncbi:MAG: gliding motility-associated C-terminal domain-containing protein, partial [Sporocytophaga sp.]|nr:gliding motility-associated C-terminal domain-containing protein [Sporocytophaga sp.]
GCTDTASVVININGQPTVSVTTPAAVCAPATIDLGTLVSGAASYSYFSDASATTVSPQVVSASGTYYIVGSNGAGCTDTASVVININGQPTVSVTTPAAVCAPATIDLGTLVSGAASYSYFSDASATTVSPQVVSASGTYYIVGSNGVGCTDTASVVININGQPTVSVTTPAAVCAPATIDLGTLVSGAASYSYFSDASATTASPQVVSASGTYYIVGSNGVGCTDTASVVININGQPTVSVTTPAAVCAPATIDLGTLVSGAASYSYFSDASATTVSPQVVSASGTYYIVGSNGAGCTDTASVVININGQPTVSVTTPAAVCAPATIDLGTLVSGAASYSYFSDASATTVSPQVVSASGTYYIVGSNGAGCTDTASVVININGQPTVSVTTPAAVCAPATIDLGTLVSGAASYSYFSDASATTASPQVVSASGTYYIVGSNGAGCTDTASVVININGQPTVSVTTPAAVCAPATIDLGTLVSGAASYSYFSDASATTASPQVVSASGTYYIVGSNGAGCTDTASVVININGQPTVSVTTPAAVCAPATIDLGTLVSGAASYSYFSDASATTASPQVVSASGTYYIVGSNGAGCTDTASVVVIINGQPTVSVTTPAAVCAPATIDLGTLVSGAASYSYFSDASATTASPQVVSTSGTYYIVGSNGAGCTDTASVVININGQPTVSVTTPAAVCAPATIDLGTLVSGAASYSYFSDASATTASPQVVSASGTYYIVGSNGVGCTDTASVVININGQPTVSVTTPAAVCAPATIDLGTLVSGAASYSYFSDASATTVSPQVVSASGTYYIVGSNGVGCTDTASVVININGQPTVSVTTPATVCAPATIDLGTLVSGAASYSYFSDASATTVSPQVVSASGTYYIVGSNGVGCTDTASVVININGQPTVSVTTPAAVCAPATIDLGTLVSGAASYSYFSDASATTASPQVVSASGTYYIVGSNGVGCTDTASVAVVINGQPTVSVTTPAPVCAPATINLGSLVSGAASYSYFSNSGATVASSQVVSASGTYYIVGTNGAGCTDTASVSVVINTQPTVAVSVPAAVCAPATIDLGTLVSGAASYSYFSDASATTASPQVVSTSGTYYIVGSNGAGCTDTASVVININGQPTVSVTTPAAVCAPATIDLGTLVSGAASYSYFSDASATTASPQVVSASGTYYIVGSNGAGCTDTVSVVININGQPTVSVTTPAAVCAPATIDLGTLVSGAASYSYFSDASATTASPQVVSASGTYYIVGSNGVGCTDTASVAVVINGQPTVSVTTPAAVCAPATIDLGTLVSGAASYSYFSDASATTASPQVVSTSGTYYIVGSNGAGCTDTASVVININGQPTVSVTTPAAVCAPATIDLGTLVSGAASYSYFSNSGATVASSQVVSTSGTYYIVGTNIAGCADTVSVNVEINPLPVVVGNNQNVCGSGPIDLTDPKVTIGSSTGLIYSYWTNAAATIPVGDPKAVSTGTYYIEGTSQEGCKAIQQVTVTVSPLPVINMPSEFTFCPLTDPVFEIEAKGTGGDTYLWTPGNVASKILPVTEPGVYQLTLINSLTTCSVQKEVKVIEECAPEVFFPNVFTPNGDGKDDVYQIFGHHVENFNITIFNRWGEIIFQSNDLEKSWDGYYLDKIMEQGVYPWTVTYEGSGKYKVPHVKQGSVLLKR